MLRAAETIRFYGTEQLTERDCKLLQWILPVVRAQEILNSYHYKTPTPDNLYQLIYLVTDDKELALRTKVKYQLETMPPI